MTQRVWAVNSVARVREYLVEFSDLCACRYLFVFVFGLCSDPVLSCAFRKLVHCSANVMMLRFSMV